MKFNIGEKVRFLSEKGQGKIIQVLALDKYILEDEHGFEQIYAASDLVKILGEFEDDLNPFNKDSDISTAKQHFSIIKNKSNEVQKDFWELDLHIESLTENHRGMSNFEIMKIQLQEFKRFFSKAKSNGIRKIVVIHGVGEGVLKNEIRTFLSNQEFIEFYDASYLEYGKGATEIQINYQM